uniref:Hexosyltransferase n=1 Tax=Geospiza parvula TaxID=87175 RepID=A0A8U8C4P8_GEOPR
MKLPPSCRLLLLPVAAALTLLALHARHSAPPRSPTVPPSPTPRPGNATEPPRPTRHPLQPPYPYPYRFLLNHPDKCRERAPFLVLLVVTSPQDLEARDAVRRTWGDEGAVPGLAVLRLFLLGVHPVFSAELRPVLQEEDALHGDLLQQDFLDTYNNLTLKTLMGLEWVSRFCPNATYVMKADHDVFLNLEYLAGLLRPPRTDFLTGYVYRWTGPLRNRAYKWFVPREVYPNDTYPPYCGGPGYVLSGDLALRVFRVAQTLAGALSVLVPPSRRIRVWKGPWLWNVPRSGQHSRCLPGCAPLQVPFPVFEGLCPAPGATLSVSCHIPGIAPGVCQAVPRSRCCSRCLRGCAPLQVLFPVFEGLCPAPGAVPDV